MLASVLIFAACSTESTKNNNATPNQQDTQKKEQPQQQLNFKAEIIGPKDPFVFGEQLNLKLSVLPRNFSATVFLNNHKITENLTDSALTLNTLRAKMGTNTLRIVAKSGSKKGETKLYFKLIADKAPQKMTYKKIKTYPHDDKAYTQGLVIHEGTLFEATGLRGESSVRQVDLKTGDIIRSFVIDSKIFGEGITIFDNKLYQLSWTSNKGFVYDLETFTRVNEFMYPTQGWGLTHDGENLIMSDGSHKLYFIDPNTLIRTGELEVWDNQKPRELLNELEYIDGFVYANVYQTHTILKINLQNGRVEQEIDFSGILSPTKHTSDTDVFNGIAYDVQTKKMYVTGKRWPELYEVEIIKK